MASASDLIRFLAVNYEVVEGISNPIIAQVSIVNLDLEKVYDEYVFPQEPVTDYRTNVHGIKRDDLEVGEHFKKVQKDVREIIEGAMLVGYDLDEFLNMLKLTHPHDYRRDILYYPRLIEIYNGDIPSFKELMKDSFELETPYNVSLDFAMGVMKFYLRELEIWGEWDTDPLVDYN